MGTEADVCQATALPTGFLKVKSMINIVLHESKMILA